MVNIAQETADMYTDLTVSATKFGKTKNLKHDILRMRRIQSFIFVSQYELQKSTYWHKFFLPELTDIFFITIIKHFGIS